jgi:WD40 repeat protein
MLRRIFMCLPLSLLLLALTACGSSSTPSGPKESASGSNGPAPSGPPLYTVTVPDKADPPPAGIAAAPVIIPDCRLVPIDKQDVPSRYDGMLDDIKVAKGQYVEANQLLAMCDSRQAKADLDSKKAKVVAAKATENTLKGEKERDAYLASKNNLSQAEYKVSELRWLRAIEDTKVAEADAKISDVALDLYYLRSKFSGVVTEIFKRRGESVKNLETVLQVYNLDRLRVEGLTLQQNIYDLREGMTVMLEPAQPRRAEYTLDVHFGAVTAVAVSNDPKNPQIVSASDDKTVLVLERTGRQFRAYAHPGAVRAVACTPRGVAANFCLSGAADGKGRIFDLTSNSDQPVRELKGQHRGAITAVTFTPDGNYCATGGEDREIRVWDVATGEPRYSLAGHKGAITSLAFTPQGKLISAARDNTLQIWDVRTDGAKQEKIIDRRSGEVTCLGVSADGRRALFDLERSLRILSLPSGLLEPQSVLQNPSGANSFTNFALFSPDGGLVLTAGAAEGRVQLWQTRTGTQRAHEIRQLQGAERISPNCAAFAPDGSFVVVGTRDRQVLVWPVPSADERGHETTAKLTMVGRVVDTSAGQVRIEAEFENPRGPDGRYLLSPGMTANMVIYPGK